MNFRILTAAIPAGARVRLLLIETGIASRSSLVIRKADERADCASLSLYFCLVSAQDFLLEKVAGPQKSKGLFTNAENKPHCFGTQALNDSKDVQ
ncbi:MAG: hypothetical protein JWL59_4557 [Chthoniobacteraceae bacterium]|nr:hypothetical protein [Chthoniobacteraceae bacterium]